MEIKKFEDHYHVKSSSGNKWYEVFPDRPFCTCPAFLFYSVKKGTVCKHVVAVRNSLVSGCNKVVEYVKEKGSVDSIELIEKFGESDVNACLARGELVESKGQIRLL